jgi:hypothetical protein
MGPGRQHSVPAEEFEQFAEWKRLQGRVERTQTSTEDIDPRHLRTEQIRPERSGPAQNSDSETMSDNQNLKMHTLLCSGDLTEQDLERINGAMAGECRTICKRLCT